MINLERLKVNLNLEGLKVNSSYLLRRVAIATRPKPENPTNWDINSIERVRHLSAKRAAREQEDEMKIYALKRARQKGLEAVSYEVFRCTLEEEESQIPPSSELYEMAKQMEGFFYTGQQILNCSDLDQIEGANENF